MEQPGRVKCTYEDCNFYFETEKEMIRHKKKETDHFYCHKCNEDCDNDTEFLIHQILSPKHTVCPSCGMEFKSVSGRDRHVEVSHSSSQRLPCRGCGTTFTKASALMQHIEKDQCRVIRRNDFETERTERSLLNDAFVNGLDQVEAVPASSALSASSGRSSSVHGGVSLLQINQAYEETEQRSGHSAVMMNSPLSETSLTNFPALPIRTGRAGIPAWDHTGGSVSVNEAVVDSSNKDSVWHQHQGNSHLFPMQEATKTYPSIIKGTDSKYDQLSEISFRTRGSQSQAGRLPGRSSWAESNLRDQSVPAAAPRFPEPDAHITTGPPPRVSRLDADKFYHLRLKCYICPAVKCQGNFATAEQFRGHLHGLSHLGSDVSCPTCLRHFQTTTALMSHMESGSKRCNARYTTNYNQVLREVTAGLIGTSGQLEDGTVKYSVPNDEGWGEDADRISTRW